MKFINEEHKNNFYNFLERFDLKEDGDPQYISSIYIATEPNIYNKILKTQKDLNLYQNPIFHLGKFEGENFVFNDSLTINQKEILKNALKIFNGENIEISENIKKSKKNIFLLIEALEINTKFLSAKY